MHCRLLVPPLARPESDARRFPALELLLARGRRSRLDVESREQWLLEAFGVAKQHDWPSAPFSLMGDGGAPGDDYWMHADPAHFRADRDRVLVGDSALLDIEAAEAAQLAASVNGHFGDALRLHVAQPARWYARLAAPPAGSTVPLRQAAGWAVETGSGTIQWHALMNEIQMLLHEHPVNEAREARGAPPINGVWLWGGGRLSPAKPEALRAVLGSDPLALGLAKCAGIPSSSLPRGAENWLERSPVDGVHLAVLADGPVESLERQWAAPLVKALRHGRIGMLTLHFERPREMVQVEATASDLRRIWRLRRTIGHYLKP